MKIVIACNPFKGSLTSIEASRAIEAGLKSVWRRAVIVSVPIADGGDGTVDAVRSAVECETVKLRVSDPLGRRRASEYLLLDGGRTAVVEMAKASGLAMLSSGERDAASASSKGTGELIRDALGRGAEKVVIGIGGSATNDGGAGIAEALGYRFLDARGRQVRPCGGELGRIARIDAEGWRARARNAEFLVASDVTNPLLGPRGATAVYSPQKGARPKQLPALEAGLANLADVVERDLGARFRDYPGAGAAGGAGYGLMAFLGARLRPGIGLMIEITGLERKMSGADLAVTGEGFMDGQSAQGKAPFGILRLARRHGVPVIALCGGVDGEDALLAAGFRAIVPIVDGPMSVEDAMAGAAALLKRAARRAALLIKTGELKRLNKEK